MDWNGESWFCANWNMEEDGFGLTGMIRKRIRQVRFSWVRINKLSKGTTMEEEDEEVNTFDMIIIF
jgi:hypothetical protein